MLPTKSFAYRARILCRHLGLILAAMLPVTAVAVEIPFLESGIPYIIELPGNDALKARVAEDLELQREENLTLKSYRDPRKIARLEQEIIEKSLRSQGYYDAEVATTVVRKKDVQAGAAVSGMAPGNPASTGTEAAARQPPVTQARDIEHFLYHVNPGPRYTIASIEFRFPGAVDIAGLELISLKPGAPFVAVDVLDNVQALKKKVLDDYCFLQVDVRYEAFITPSDKTAGLVYSMPDSPQVSYGEVILEGLQTVQEGYLRQQLNLESGDCFKRNRIDAAKVNLLRTNLVASVESRLGPIEEGRVDVFFDVVERFHRTIKAGVGYSTDEGPNLSLGWEHRNILGAAQKVDVSGRFSEVRQNINSEFEVPNFINEDNRLVMEAELSQENLDSYDARVALTGMRIEHHLTDRILLTAGTRFKYSEVNDDGETEEFGLLSFPLQFKWDSTDDLLDPTRGQIFIAEVSPYVDLLMPERRFVKSTLSGNLYFTFDTYLRPTIAMRAAAGSISGEGNRDIPADERYYVGGGGSVRGYPFQTLSTIEDDDPVGGSSFQEVSLETRFRVGGNWGLVTFVDGGYAFEDATHDYNDGLLWGAGFGIRYYTLFAPIRADIAFPLNKREDVDDDFQLYISIGQAF